MTYSYTLLFVVIIITADKKDDLLSSVKAKQVHSQRHPISPLALYPGETFANVQKEEHTRMFTIVLFVIVKKIRKKNLHFYWIKNIEMNSSVSILWNFKQLKVMSLLYL